MNSFRLTVLAAIVFSSYDLASTSADIVQASSQGAESFGFANSNIKIGQSFTATANELFIDVVSFMWANANGFLPNPTFTAKLYNGQGYGLELGASAPVTVTGATPDGAWIDFTFSPGIALIPGNTYSISFDRDNPTTGRSGAFGWQNTFGSALDANSAYVGGYRLLDNGSPYIVVDDGEGGMANGDLAFRVMASAAVPEAGAWLLVGAVATGACVVQRFRRTRARAA